MSEGEVSGGGDRFFSIRRFSPISLPPPELESEYKLPPTKQARSITPRGQRFSKLSDAYLNITSRLGSKQTTHKALDQHQSSSTDSVVSSVAVPRLVRSQDELQARTSASAMRFFMKKSRRTTLGSIDTPEEDLAPKADRGDNAGPSLRKQIDNELPTSSGPPQDTTSSTIKRIVAQYDGSTSSLRAEYNNSREYCWKTELPRSQPPQASLPEPPPMNTQRSAYAHQGEHDSPGLDSSITDSQHLLDAEAQAHELDEVGRALFPLPLNIARTLHDTEITRQQHYNALRINDDFMEPGKKAPNDNLSAHRYDGCCKTYLKPQMQRDISQELRRLSSSPKPMYSAENSEHFPVQQEQPQDDTFSQSGLLTPSTGGKRVRHIKVVIGRESKISKDNHEGNGAYNDAKHDHRDICSEDGDWITEATSDVGFGISTVPLAEGPLTGGFKKAGSSIADYSDDGYEDILDRFGSQERILQNPEGDDKDKMSFSRRMNQPKFASVFSRRHGTRLELSSLPWASTTQEEAGQFRPQILRKNKNPYREFNNRQNKTSGRLVFNFDQNAPPRYEFRDSISEYEPAAASTKANCGTRIYDTRGSLPSPVSDVAEENHLHNTDTEFNRSAEFDADAILSNNFPQQSKHCQTVGLGQDTRFSIYAADRKNQIEGIDNREFAAASSYYDQPSANSVRSKFNFELLPLDQARRRDRSKRYSGEINEDEPTAARIKRNQSVRSIKRTHSPPKPPTKAFLTGPDLSANFSSPKWQAQNSDLTDTPAPFSMGCHESATSVERKHQKVNSLGTKDNSSSFTTKSAAESLWYGQKAHFGVPVQDMYQYRLRPALIAPDDYVSDHADDIRRSCFYVLAVLSILPFVGVLVLTGAFSEGLKWATRGEVDRLNSRQQRIIKCILISECVLYTGGVVAVVVYFVLESKAYT
ncbi:hypothetical protein F5B22DRAFT_643680 [Xylaria bambusicola]|uniref:uncharacterized protein n=1 Tax=Xylaria bambusicola TaxID=326684 RepID=UPI0020080DDC|nr:uncharacterized protein F5B22DRAFT_643680 [Xylaria bambusicola]KAI0521514.1 hypothetical protein F5B22DRAFT_643680 [Xylaria bambusicola]